MKALLPACATVLLALSSARGSEPPASGPTIPPDPTNPSGAAANVTQPAPEAPPARPDAPATRPDAKRPDPALDLLPATPGQILPEPTLTPDNPGGTAIVPKPETPATAKAKVNKTEVVEQDLALRIRFRQAKTRALEDPAVQAEWHTSIIVPTDLLRREALTRYYKLLYARMLKSDSSIQKLVTTERDLSLRRLQQSRIAPTEALDADESSRRGYVAAPFTADQF